MLTLHRTSLIRGRAPIALTIVLFAVGCQHQVTPPKPAAGAIPARTITLPGLPAPDLKAVAGRTIVLDPGHGGAWPGAVARSNGLRESDVNLAVALRVQEMLEAAGARVLLTRQDNSTPDPASGSQDLTARVELANREGADVFVSIHHNADISLAAGMNDLEIYYKLGDEGPSLDLGQALMRALATGCRRDATAKRLFPGNYHVLRKATVPAALTEASYMSDPENAARLAEGKAAAEEANSLAQGLAGYFALDPPRLAKAGLVESANPEAPMLALAFERGGPFDLESFSVSLDSKACQGHIVAASEDRIIWMFSAPPPNGIRIAEVRLRNAKGAAGLFLVELAIARPAASIQVVQKPGAVPPNARNELLFEATVRDGLGWPVADGTTVELDASPPASAATAVSAATKDGCARFYLAANKTPEALRFRVAGANSHSMDVEFAVERGDGTWRTLRVIDAISGAGVPGAAISAANGGEWCTASSPDGWAAVPEGIRSVRIQRDGYEALESSLDKPHLELTLAPVQGGVLHGKRIVLDPASGGREAGAIGPQGTRACDLSLDIALRAASILRAAGAEVVLTRTTDIDTTPLERVVRSMERPADLFISLTFGSPAETARLVDDSGVMRRGGAAYVAHYPNSANGERLARAIAQACGGAEVGDTVAYVVQQTACPAVLLQPGDLRSVEEEQRFLAVETRREVAKQVLEGILRYFAAGDVRN